MSEAFRKAVATYRKLLRKAKGSCLITLDPGHEEAFFSVAALSMALSQLGCDTRIEMKSGNLEQVKKLWTVNFARENGLKNTKTRALDAFLALADRKCGGTLARIFSPPEVFLNSGREGFTGTAELPYLTSWRKRTAIQGRLVKTCRRIWEQVYALRKTEKASISFEALRDEKKLKYPLQDYLDSYEIAWGMFRAAEKHVISLSASTPRDSPRDEAERIGELKATLLGCELSRHSTEPVFRAYAKLSRALGLEEPDIPHAAFAISGEGYSGRHVFGERIGYPAPGGKTRWQSPGQMLTKLDFSPQTRHDPRKPRTRIAFTSTLPVDVFLRSCTLDWLKMAEKDKKIIAVLDRCDHVLVKGKGRDSTELRIVLAGKDGRRYARGSDVATRSLIREDIRKRTGVLAGTMGNIPAGEAFVTPESVWGRMIGDVVISVDRSYRLGKGEPLVISCRGNEWKLVSGPEEVKKALKRRMEEGWKSLLEQEKSGALPKEAVEIKKRNFRNIGEFAINTNPKAELCDYLIVNEKIANMIHLALGSGFDPDRSTVYHCDIVIDAPRQKLTITGIEKKEEGEKEHVLMKDGKLIF